MYQDLARRRDQRLLDLRQQKTSHGLKRKGLLPEHKDRKILSEAAALASGLAGSATLCLVSGDGDFYEFKEEIKNEFRIVVIGENDLPGLIGDPTSW